MTPEAVPAELVDRSRLLDLTGGRVFVQDLAPPSPTGTPLLLLHDVLGCGFEFAPILGPLLGERRVVVLDFPGAGESDRPTPEDFEDYSVSRLAAAVAEALHCMNLPTVDVVGLGFGALVGLALAADYPGAVRGVVAVAPPFFGLALPYELGLARVPALGDRAFVRAYRRADLRRTLANGRVAPELLDSLLVDVLWDRLGRAGGLPAARAMLLQVDRAGALLTRLERATLPLLLVWGDGDAIVPTEQAETVRERLPWAELAVIEGCGHAAVQERPHRVLECIGEFCRGLDARVGTGS